MDKAVTRILRSEDVELGGRVQLPVTQATRDEGRWSARIVENHAEFVVIEVTCCCGARTHLRCEYAENQK